MKTLIKIIMINIIVLLSILLLSCLELFDGGAGNDTIYLKFKPIDFGGDWTYFSNTYSPNYLRITLPNDIYDSGQIPIKVNEYIEFDIYIKKYTQPAYDPEIIHVFKPIDRDPVIENIFVEFRKFDNVNKNDDIVGDPFIIEPDPNWLINNDNKLKTGYTSVIPIRINADTSSATDFTVEIENKPGSPPTLYEDRYFNFDVDVTHVKEARTSIGALNHAESINIAVMGDGYDEWDIRYFKEYVENAFQSPAHFHETEYELSYESEYVRTHNHITNNFFEKYWDFINVYMFETISLDSGIDNYIGINQKKNFFDFNSGKKDPGPGNISRMKKVISSTYYKTRLHPDDIDVYIILVNDDNIWAYTYPYGNEISYRNGQPVHSVIIQAPKYRYVDSIQFHDDVLTYSIAHELGHAMARLLDEYDYYYDKDEKISDIWAYQKYYRNISDKDENENFKWQELIELGYESPHPYQTISHDNDQLLGYYLHPYFFNSDGAIIKYYIPTINSTMRQSPGSKNYQFGPVNTYHMEGSFKTRLGKIQSQDPDDYYVWFGYSFENFKEDWKPERFK